MTRQCMTEVLGRPRAAEGAGHILMLAWRLHRGKIMSSQHIVLIIVYKTHRVEFSYV
jgi:hypothetical protein